MSKSPLPFEIGVEIDSKETLGEVDKTGNTATNSAGLQENEEDIVTQRNGFSDSNACDAEASEQDVSGIQRDGDQNRTHILGRVGLTILIFYNVRYAEKSFRLTWTLSNQINANASNLTVRMAWYGIIQSFLTLLLSLVAAHSVSNQL